MTAEIPLTETLEGLAEASLKPTDNVDQLKALVSRLHTRIKAQGFAFLTILYACCEKTRGHGGADFLLPPLPHYSSKH
ncbi:hypothetical protein E2C01_083122 [Portunus trituberculatus]|uniref:Uncharacterized protein n=1 Tax=Portunus trituberculatus TaxID=210409 RepID=A0A5B7J6Y6_PORTR|nr:hypothetical protein [Portunus trituberculatus]